MACNHDLLVGGNDMNLDATGIPRNQWCIFGIALRVDFDSEELQSLAYSRADTRRVLANSSGEN